jgi:outer membrane protein
LRIKNIKADFNILLGRQPEIDFGVSPEFIYLNDLSYENLKQDLSKQNKAVLMARSQVSVASSQIREAQSAFYPRIGLYGAYTYGSQQNEVGVISNTKNFGPALGASLTWNLFNGLNDKNEVKNRKLNFENAETESNQIDYEANANLYKAFNSYAVWRDLLKLESLNVEAAQEDVSIAKTNLELGGINDVEFRVIQLGALDAEYRLLFAEYQSRLAQIELLRLSGILAQTLNF